MEYKVFAKNLKVDEKLQAYLDKKIEKLGKFQQQVTSCNVELDKDTKSQSGNIFRAEINLGIKGKLFRAEVRAENIKAAIDMAQEKIVRQVTRDKEKGQAKM